MNAEQEIVKPYLDKLKENISFLDTYDDIEVEDEFGNTNRTKYVDFYEVMETIDDLLSGEKTMTREEAIEIIKAYRERLTSSASNLLDSDIKAFDMAIESLEKEPRKGQWLRMSDLSEREDDRYKCSRCGNVIHYKDKMNLYTFNSWCGRCGSDNGRK